jgi:hypothetical protein
VNPLFLAFTWPQHLLKLISEILGADDLQVVSFESSLLLRD